MIISITFGLGLLLGLCLKGLRTYKRSDRQAASEIRRRMTAEYQTAELQQRLNDQHRYVTQVEAEVRHLRTLINPDDDTP
jgi:hypothetical protein